MSFSVDTSYITRILSELVQIDSRNPSLTPGSPGEVMAGAYLADCLNDLGLQVRTHEIEPGRVNVVGRLKGTGGGRTLMLNGHLDTVGHTGMSEPLSGRVQVDGYMDEGARI